MKIRKKLVVDEANVVAAHGYSKLSVLGVSKIIQELSLLLTSNYKSEDPRFLLCKPWVPPELLAVEMCRNNVLNK